MAASLRLLVALILLASGLAGLGGAQPEWLSSLTRPAHEPVWRTVLPQPEEVAIALKRGRAKAAVIARVRAGELTLFEAAAWFRWLNSEPASAPDAHWRLLPGASLDEKLCRQVICWAESETAAQGSVREGETMADRLRAELARHLAEHGEVVLPELDAE
jgi:hypothetical protein